MSLVVGKKAKFEFLQDHSVKLRNKTDDNVYSLLCPKHGDHIRQHSCTITEIISFQFVYHIPSFIYLFICIVISDYQGRYEILVRYQGIFYYNKQSTQVMCTLFWSLLWNSRVGCFVIVNLVHSMLVNSVFYKENRCVVGKNVCCG